MLPPAPAASRLAAGPASLRDANGSPIGQRPRPAADPAALAVWTPGQPTRAHEYTPRAEEIATSGSAAPEAANCPASSGGVGVFFYRRWFAGCGRTAGARLAARGRGSERLIFIAAGRVFILFYFFSSQQNENPTIPISCSRHSGGSVSCDPRRVGRRDGAEPLCLGLSRGLAAFCFARLRGPARARPEPKSVVCLR
jgi:hypothetical protein